MFLIGIIIAIVIFFKVFPPIYEKWADKKLRDGMQALRESEKALQRQRNEQQQRQLDNERQMLERYRQSKRDEEAKQWAHKTLIDSNIEFMFKAYQGLCDAADKYGCTIYNEVRQEYFILTMYYMEMLVEGINVSYEDVSTELDTRLKNDEWSDMLNGLTLQQFAQVYVDHRSRISEGKYEEPWDDIAIQELYRINSDNYAMEQGKLEELTADQVDILVNQYAKYVDNLNKM